MRHCEGSTEGPAETDAEVRQGGVSRRTVLAGLAGAAALPLLAGAPAHAAAVAGARRPPVPQLGPITVFAPPQKASLPGVKYARVARLFDGNSTPGPGYRPRTLVATCENLFDPVHYAYPVFHSVDDGRTWTRIGAVFDPRTGAKPRWQPFLYALPASFAGLPRGALLCAGNAIPNDFSSTSITVLASTDGGHHWRYVSTVATGGAPNPANGQTPVWEPFLLLHNGRLICYYSDQRDPEHGQKLVHQTSTDLMHWGPVVNDVAEPTYNKRPGMPTVAQMGDGRWIMTWEDGNNPDVSFGVAYAFADDPEGFGGAPRHLLRTVSGLVPIGSPVVTWVTGGGQAGTIVVSAGENAPLFLNRHGGDDGQWIRLQSVVPRGYSREVRPWGADAIMVIGGGPGDFPPRQMNKVQFGIQSVVRPGAR